MTSYVLYYGMSSVLKNIKNIKTPHLEVKGGRPLSGYLEVGGAKNSALVLLAASLLTQETIEISNVPKLTDIDVMTEILQKIGVKISKNVHKINLRAQYIQNVDLPYELVHSLRASFFCIGPLLSRVGKAKVPLPGGCEIGARPLDEHIKGLKALGAKIFIEGGIVNAYISNKSNRLKGTKIIFKYPSVGATETVLMAACLAKGKTKIINAAKEPEIKDLTNMLNTMGAKIKGAGTSEITIEGVDSLKGCSYSVMPDRIEAGTFLIAAAITRSNLLIGPVIIDHLTSLLKKLKESGCKILKEGCFIRLIAKDIKGVDITTGPYPAFPTDLQAPFMALMTTANGTSTIKETVFENRMQHISQLKKLGARIILTKNSAHIQGVNQLDGSILEGSDLRSSAAIILASLAAKGKSTIYGLNHLDRGYENLEQKFNNAGSHIIRKNQTIFGKDLKFNQSGAEDNQNIEPKAA